MTAPARLGTWLVRFGSSTREYFTAYHAEQFADALRSHGVDVTIEVHL